MARRRILTTVGFASLILAGAALTPTFAAQMPPNLQGVLSATQAPSDFAPIVRVARSGGYGQGTNGTGGASSSGNGPGPRPSTGAPTYEDPGASPPGEGPLILPPFFPSFGGRQPGDPVGRVLTLSHEVQSEIDACRFDSPACIADALDEYADRLEALTTRLGPGYRALPTIVRQAARKIRVARSKTEVAIALKSAITQVGKTIALLRAEDPNAGNIGAVVGRAVDQTLEVAQVKLLRSSDL
jgi:hypothetical protein